MVSVCKLRLFLQVAKKLWLREFKRDKGWLERNFAIKLWRYKWCKLDSLIFVDIGKHKSSPSALYLLTNLEETDKGMIVSHLNLCIRSEFLRYGASCEGPSYSAT
jgi:hypothetical protein